MAKELNDSAKKLRIISIVEAYIEKERESVKNLTKAEDLPKTLDNFKESCKDMARFTNRLVDEAEQALEWLKKRRVPKGNGKTYKNPE